MFFYKTIYFAHAGRLWQKFARKTVFELTKEIIVGKIYCRENNERSGIGFFQKSHKTEKTFMKIKPLNTHNLGTGFLYFYVHFVTEVACFFALFRYVEDPPAMWLLFFAYDMLAFIPQGIFGYICDRFKKVSLGIAGLVLLAAALLLEQLGNVTFLSMVILCIGNAFTHVDGAEVTLRTSNGSLSHSAIFVAGGSFGVVTGQLLASAGAPYWIVYFLIATAVPFVILGHMYLGKDPGEDRASCRAFRYSNPNVGKALIVVLSVAVVVVRGYMAYGIPISWKKTTLQSIILFTFMGIGKALGGVLADVFGVKKVALSSILVALPFLLLGDRYMFVSLVGVMFFSMTMAVTLAVLVSVLPNAPGLAFGFTTIGLFLGTVPVFFFKITSLAANCIMLSVLTAVCVVCFAVSIRKDEIG